MAYGSMLGAEEDPRSTRKARGAFYTPLPLASFITRWAIRASDEIVCEPACGEAVFLLSALERLEELGCKPSSAERHVHGFEIHRQSARAARKKLASNRRSCDIVVSDFLCESGSEVFDVVVGNPPYVRFQAVGDLQQEARKRISEQSGVQMSALSSLWAPFLVQSALLLKRGGRLGLVLPAELLTVNYAGPIRTFLLDAFASVQLVTFDARVFPEVQEEVVVLLADGYQVGSSSSIAWRQCRDLGDLDTAKVSDYVPGSREGRWSSMFASQVALDSLEGILSSGEFCPLSSWGRIALGLVTGNNDFFALSNDSVRHWGLSDADTVPLCPPGTRHLRRLDFSADILEALGTRGSRVHLFYPKGENVSPEALSYIAQGKTEGVHEGYKCRKRPLWWRVPLGDPPDVFITYINAYGPNLCSNSAGAVVLNSCHGLYYGASLSDTAKSLLPLACWNSVTLFGAEIEGRAYGGGMLKLEPREASRLPVPSPALVERASSDLGRIKLQVEKLLASRKFDMVVGLVDEVLLNCSKGLRESEMPQMKTSCSVMRMRRGKRGKGAKDAEGRLVC